MAVKNKTFSSKNPKDAAQKIKTAAVESPLKAAQEASSSEKKSKHKAKDHKKSDHKSDHKKEKKTSKTDVKASKKQELLSSSSAQEPKSKSQLKSTEKASSKEKFRVLRPHYEDIERALEETTFAPDEPSREQEETIETKSSDPLEVAFELFKLTQRLQEFPEIGKSTQHLHGLYRDMTLIDSGAIAEHLVVALKKRFEDSDQLFKATKDYASDLSVLMQKMFLTPTFGSFKAQDESPPVITEASKDKRFRGEGWKKSPYFSFLKQSYLLWNRWMEDVFTDINGLSPQEQRRVNFYVRQLCDAMSPSNIPWMNPDALQKSLESGGQSVLKGLENLYRDFEKGKGRLDISMVDEGAFKLGENIATTPGKVVYQNELIQLIQYEASTKQVFETPVLIVPPCINKYYVFDLRPENSFVRWLRDQGYTVFIISWVNPSQDLSKKSFEDYVLEGVLEAARVSAEICHVDQINAMGFCIGGNFLAIANAYAATKKHNPFKSATYLATIFDFSKAGDLTIFIEDQNLDNLERAMQKQGYMDGEHLKRTFNLLRANDLIWSFVINNYFLGDKPTAFDFLYWNSDSTNLPAKMYTYYLRKFFYENLLIKPDALKVADVGIDLGQIKTPSFFLNTIEDHIAPWQSGFAGTQAFKSAAKKFVLAGSGHVVGIFNPPSKNKYSFFENDHLQKSPDAWLQSAKESLGSWWSSWIKWVESYAGKKVPARKIGSIKYMPLEDAPGSYVLPPKDGNP